ncbi:MAG: GNAT family N-acetyltransferase [Polyangiaceae bacterium]
MVIRTARLDLIAATAEHLRAEDNPQLLGELLQAEVPEGWPPGSYDRDAIDFFLAKAIEGGEAVIGWYAWYAVRRPVAGERASLVAAVGYFGPPSGDGTVEIGYSVVPSARNQGYATEAAEALTRRALALPGVERVTAEAHDTNVSSIRALLRCGFRRTGPGREEGHSRYERRRFNSTG